MATLNRFIQPAKKAEAFEIARAILEGEDVNMDDKKRLYLYFSPSKSVSTKKASDSFAWIAQFCEKPGTARPYLEYVYSNGKRLAGTNGHVLAYADTDLPEGFYCPRTKSLVEGCDFKFPDIERLFLDDNQDPQPLELHLGEPAISNNGKRTQRCYKDLAFDDVYLRMIMKGGNPYVTRYLQDDQRIQGTTDLGNFIVMSLRW